MQTPTYFKPEKPFIYDKHGDEKKMIENAQKYFEENLRIFVSSIGINNYNYIWMANLPKPYIVKAMNEIKVAFRFKKFK